VWANERAGPAALVTPVVPWVNRHHQMEARPDEER